MVEAAQASALGIQAFRARVQSAPSFKENLSWPPPVLIHSSQLLVTTVELDPLPSQGSSQGPRVSAVNVSPSLTCAAVGSATRGTPSAQSRSGWYQGHDPGSSLCPQKRGSDLQIPDSSTSGLSLPGETAWTQRHKRLPGSRGSQCGCEGMALLRLHRG